VSHLVVTELTEAALTMTEEAESVVTRARMKDMVTIGVMIGGHLGVGLLLQGGRGVRRRRCLKEEAGIVRLTPMITKRIRATEVVMQAVSQAVTHLVATVRLTPMITKRIRATVAVADTRWDVHSLESAPLSGDL